MQREMGKKIQKRTVVENSCCGKLRSILFPINFYTISTL